MENKKLLHVGCGPKRIDETSEYFRSGHWLETRLDIDASVQPDVIGSLTDMSAIASGSMQAVFSSHNIEHLYPHEVPVAVAEMRRVLDAEGLLVVTCPDIQSIARLVADDKLLEPAYQSAAGPIAAIDMLYGHRAAMGAGNLYMAHRCGFTLRVLMAVLRQAGFAAVAGLARPAMFDLWVVASVDGRSEEAIKALLLSQFKALTAQAAEGTRNG